MVTVILAEVSVEVIEYKNFFNRKPHELVAMLPRNMLYFYNFPVTFWLESIVVSLLVFSLFPVIFFLNMLVVFFSLFPVVFFFHPPVVVVVLTIVFFVGNLTVFVFAFSVVIIAGFGMIAIIGLIMITIVIITGFGMIAIVIRLATVMCRTSPVGCFSTYCYSRYGH